MMLPNGYVYGQKVEFYSMSRTHLMHLFIGIRTDGEWKQWDGNLPSISQDLRHLQSWKSLCDVRKAQVFHVVVTSHGLVKRQKT